LTINKRKWKQDTGRSALNYSGSNTINGRHGNNFEFHDYICDRGLTYSQETPGTTTVGRNTGLPGKKMSAKYYLCIEGVVI
jgi:hypothetical protein